MEYDKIILKPIPVDIKFPLKILKILALNTNGEIGWAYWSQHGGTRLFWFASVAERRALY